MLSGMKVDNINWIFNFKYQKLKMTCLLKITAYNLVQILKRLKIMIYKVAVFFEIFTYAVAN